MSASNGLSASASGYRQLAGGLTVTRLGLGSMQLPGPGVWGPPPDRDRALSVLREALRRGVTHIDTSAVYGPQVANQLIHDALHPYPPDVVIATKVGVTRDHNRGFAPAARPGQLRDQVEANLEQLQLEQLDLVYLRVGGDGLLAPDPTPFADSFGALVDLQRRGIIRHLGLSGCTAEQLAQARALAPVVAVQNRYHLLDRSSAAVLAACEQHGIAFVAYFPLAAGMLNPDLDDTPLPPGMGLSRPQRRTLDEIAGRHGATRPQLALAWLLHHSGAILAIPGTSSVAHLHQNIAAADLRLTSEDVTTLDALSAA
jgi:aryl-alcohol dehydrogenase-like predicted oxidoreductase